MSKKQHRVLFVMQDIDAGGAQRVMLRLMRALLERNHKVMLALKCKFGSMVEFVPEGIPLYECKGAELLFSLKLLALVWCKRPDVLITTLTKMNIRVLRLKKYFPPMKIIIREGSIFSQKMKYVWSRPEMMRRQCVAMYPLADAILCNSKAMMDDLIELLHLSKEKVHLMRNPISKTEINKKATQANPFQGSGPFLLSVGRLDALKGHEFLIRSVKEIKKDFPGVELHILGEGKERSRLGRLIECENLVGAVTMCGVDKNPYRYMKYADLFLHASMYEGSPNVIIEALACGCPVVALESVGGVKELCEQFAPFAKYSDKKHFCSNVVTYLKQNKKNICPDHIFEPFNLDVSIVTLEKVFS